MLIITVNCALAIDNMCGDTVTPNTVCNMVTPYLLCVGDYNYSVYNSTNITSSGNLTEMVSNTSIYYFEFNQSEGDYIVKLCDESTREIQVKGDENTMIAVILFISILTIVFGAATFKFEGELRFFFLLLSAIFAVIGLNLIANMSIGTTYETLLWKIYIVSLSVFMFLVFYVIIKIFMMLRLRKNELNTQSFSKMYKMK